MLLFCPLCSNALTVGQGELGLDFVCETCTFVHQIEQKITNRVYYKLKELDDVLGGKVWKYGAAFSCICQSIKGWHVAKHSP